MKYFKLEEFITSDTATKYHIDNTPDAFVREHIVELVDKILDPMRDAWADFCRKKGYIRCGIKVTSGYRCPVLNSKVGGKKNSAHTTGYAADLVPLNGEIGVFIWFIQKWVKEKNIMFDQCIDEYNKWLHIAIKNNTGEQRKQIFKIK